MRSFFMKSERINFGVWNSEDIELARRLWGNRQVTQYISAKGYFDDNEIDQRLNKEINNGKVYNVQYWPIFMATSGEFIGCCGLRPYDEKNNIYELGIHLLPEFWGQGLASEAVQKVVKYAFEELKVNNLFAGHNPKNISSRRMLEKNGFHFVREEFYEPTGLMHPSYLYKN